MEGFTISNIHYRINLVIKMNLEKMLKELNLNAFKMLETLVTKDQASVIVFKNNKSEIVYVNDLFYKKHPQFASCKEKVIGLTDFDLFPDAHDHALQAYHDEQTVLKTGEPINLFEIEGIDASGNTIVAHTRKYPIYNYENQINGVFVITEDVSHDIKALEENRERNAYLMQLNEKLTLENSVDALSHLYNRRYIHEKIDYLQKLYKEKKSPYSIILIDLDNFKGINDHYGHQFGDHVIAFVGETLLEIKKQLYPSMEPCRYGGDEFLIILPTCQKEGAVAIANEIKQTFDHKILDDVKYQQIVKMSMGIATAEGHESSGEILKKCDQQLYLAKNTGKHKIMY